MSTFLSTPAGGRLCIVAASILWSTSGAFVKTLALPPETVALYRTLAAGTFLIALFLAARRPASAHPLMLVMMLAFAVMNYLFIQSTTYTTSANAIFLQYTAPLWMTLGSIFLLGEPAIRRNVVAALGTIVGVVIIVLGNRSAGTNEQWGIAYGLISGSCYAIVTLVLRQLRAHDSLWMTALNHLAAASLMGIGQAIFAAFSSTGTHAPAPLTDPTKWFVLILFGVAQMGIPYVLFGIGLKTVSPQEAGILTLIEPVLNPLWAYASVGEVPSAPTAIGGGVLLTVLGLRYLPIRRPKFIPPSSPEGTG